VQQLLDATIALPLIDQRPCRYPLFGVVDDAFDAQLIIHVDATAQGARISLRDKGCRGLRIRDRQPPRFACHIPNAAANYWP
jgi:hypothetical protein